ncbi:ETEC_3214 domain-containing protein [Kribbella sp. CA-294648]|uniref:ETEC_3214 domain-containing protein n=1 Tax=Kribbella sp. CA-294648 TaxID=3239948 RepID=UPI003D8AD29B
MAVMVNEEYVRNLFGSPAYGGVEHGSGNLTWVTPYLHIAANFKHGSVNGFVITVVDPTFLLPLEGISLGKLNGRLGRQTFESTSRNSPDSQSLSIGARRYGYREVHYFGNPGGYLHYLLAVSDSSPVGRFEPPPDVVAGEWLGGDESDDDSRAVNYMRKYSRPNTVGIYIDYADEIPSAGLDGDTFRLLPTDTSRWRRLERAVARVFRPF